MPIINCVFLDDFNRMGLLRENKNNVFCNIYLTLLQATILKTEAIMIKKNVESALILHRDVNTWENMRERERELQFHDINFHINRSMPAGRFGRLTYSLTAKGPIGPICCHL